MISDVCSERPVLSLRVWDCGWCVGEIEEEEGAACISQWWNCVRLAIFGSSSTLQAQVVPLLECSTPQNVLLLIAVLLFLASDTQLHVPPPLTI